MIDELLSEIGVTESRYTGGDIPVHTPIDGSQIAAVHSDDAASVARRVTAAQAAFKQWRLVPAPERGELVRLFGLQLRQHKDALGQLVSIECGKIKEEGLGEVQEMIDICDLAVGQSRQLFGYTIASERPGHHMRESWHPLGPVGLITAFNFPVAPWSWNAALALVCGDPLIWKPSDKTPLTALACQALLECAAAAYDGDVPEALSQVVIGGAETGQALVDNPDVPLISATGSTRMGRAVGQRVAARFGRSILELGGNNAMIVTPSADLDMAVRAIVFSAAGTAGQRCTSLRRLIVHESIREQVVERVKKAYADLSVGDPLSGALVGPLVDYQAYEQMGTVLSQAGEAGARVTGGQRELAGDYPDAYYVRPALVELDTQTDQMREETFAPILYVIGYEDFDAALALHNDVPQGLSSCIFTTDLREAERFTSDVGSDCGIANVNVGPSGAEIGGAFGGEKETGGGRESGSDVWKSYMRRQTNTVNYSSEMPLAQGIRFD